MRIVQKSSIWHNVVRIGFAYLLAPVPVFAQSTAVLPAPIIFTPGTGLAQPLIFPPPHPQRAGFDCAALPGAATAILSKYTAPSFHLTLDQVGLPIPAPPVPPKHMLDEGLLKAALDSYALHNCGPGSGSGPAVFVVIDFAKPSTQPRLHRIDIATGDGIDAAVLVAHGIGSDPDDDGIAQNFGNWQDSLMSSLGAARGAEVYTGNNGRSLRLDGLDATNSSMRSRDIVAHSYNPDARRYFNASFRAARSGRPGMSEGCFVVEPHLRDWLFDLLADGGFLYAGLSGERRTPAANSNTPVVTFVSGTGGAKTRN
jgi:L,D-transpeptidase catalytic domain